MGGSSNDDSDSVEESELGRKEHWDAVYKQELTDLQQLGQEGELWFGEDVMDTMLRFIVDQTTASLRDRPQADLSILDIGTGNGVLPLELASLGHSRVTGSDYSQSSIELARAVAERRGVTSVQWLVDDVLHSSIQDRYDVITDKGTFDAIGLSEGGLANQAQYINSVHSLLQPGGLLFITSCNNTLEELLQAFTSGRQLSENGGIPQEGKNEVRAGEPSTGSVAPGPHAVHSLAGSAPDSLARSSAVPCMNAKDITKVGGKQDASEAEHDRSGCADGPARWEYVDHVRTYKVYFFGGFEGTRVCTVAFKSA